MTTTTSMPSPAETGEDKLIAVARHIARTIGRTDTMTDDIIQIFSSFDRRFSREKLEPPGRGTAAADRKIRALDRKVSLYMASPTPIWSGCESEGFLRVVDGVIEAWREIHAASQGDQDEADEETAARRAVVSAADGLLHRVMLRLEDEFRILMDQCAGDDGGYSPQSSPPRDDAAAVRRRHSSSSSSSPSYAPRGATDYNYAVVLDDCLPWGTLSDLYEIARRMSAAGYGKACALAYSVPRLASLQASISRLGFHSHHWTTEEVHAKPWPDLAEEIRRWTHAAKVAFRVLFPSERRLCDRVFPDALSPVASLAFADVCRDPALGILGFADAVAVGSKAPDRLFAVVEMYEALRDLIPDVDALFVSPPEGAGDDGGCRFVRSEATTVCARLGVTVRGMLLELESLVRRDPAPPANTAAIPGGGVHPITRYVLNYLRTVSASARTLEEILLQDEGLDPTAAVPANGASNSDAVGASSALAFRVACITEILVANLEDKSKAYRDTALSYVFLMNNGRYIIQKANGTELGQLLGDEWLLRQSTRLRQWHASYQKASWTKLVAILQNQPDGDGATASSAKSLRSRFRRFNACLEELSDAQAGWVVADDQLRAEIRISAVGIVLPAYRNLLGQARALEFGKHQQVLERCVKYAPEDVEARINAIFQGSWKKP